MSDGARCHYCRRMPCQCPEVVPKLQPNTQRLWDLVRQMRHQLFDTDLITKEEFAELVVDHPAVARLETYDEMRARIRELDSLLEDRNKLLADYQRSLAEVLALRAEVEEAHFHVGRLEGSVAAKAAALQEIREECKLNLSCNHPGDDACADIDDCIGCTLMHIVDTALGSDARGEETKGKTHA